MTLVELDVPKLVLTGDQIKFLPRSLLLLSTTLSQVSRPDLLDFPRGLHTLVTNDSDSEYPTKYLSVQDWKVVISTYRPFWRIWESDIAKISLELDLASQSAKNLHSNTIKALATQINDIDPRVLRRFSLYQNLPAM